MPPHVGSYAGLLDLKQMVLYGHHDQVGSLSM